MSIEKLFHIFKKNLKTKERYKNEFVSYFFHCPNNTCPTNTLGNRSYGKDKLSITFSKKVFHCWICSYSGFVLEIAKKYFPIEDYRECNELINKNNKYQYYNRKDNTFINDFDWNKYGFKSISSNEGIDNEYRNYGLYYLIHERGLTHEIINFYNICYHPFDKIYKNFIIVPSYNSNSEIDFFIARNYKEKIYKLPYKEKNKIIFNEKYINFSEELIITEGLFHYLKLHGYNRTILGGSELNKNSKLFNEILKNKTSIKLLLDKDAKNKSLKIQELLINNGIKVQELSIEDIGLEDIGDIDINNKEQLDNFLKQENVKNRFDILKEKLQIC